MTIDDAIIEQIASRVAEKLAPLVCEPRKPRDDDLMDAHAVGAFLHLSPRVLLEKVAKERDFPSPVRRPTASGRSRSLWFRRDILAYAKKNIVKKS